MEKEDGEMSDENMVVDDEAIKMDTGDISIVNTSNNSGVVSEQLEKTDANQLEEQAKRFGLNLVGSRAITQKQIDELYDNVTKEINERHFRFDTLHLRGIEDLTTKEIFEYLEDYKPVSLEWVNRMSCNIVCQDHISAALAILGHSREIKDERLKDMLRETDANHWREGFPHPKNDCILFRFATNSDKNDAKIKSQKNFRPRQIKRNDMDNTNSKNPWGDLCQTWGINDHQEVFNRHIPYDSVDEEEEEYEEIEEKVVKVQNARLAKRLGKRQHIVKESDESSSDTEWTIKSKVPRMRMHADDEETTETRKLQKIKQEPFSDARHDATLSIEIANEEPAPYIPRPTTKLSDKFKVTKEPNNRTKERSSIRSRLGVKLVESDSNESSDDSSDSARHITRSSKVHKVSSAVDNTSSTVWSRLENQRSESNSLGDLRDRLKSKKHVNDDLRNRIDNSNSGRYKLRVEIDNDSYRSK